VLVYLNERGRQVWPGAWRSSLAPSCIRSAKTHHPGVTWPWLHLARCRVLGLSKFARIAHACAHRLHVQERLVAEIVDEISWLTGSDDVAVVAPGKHLCMTMRGIQMPHLIFPPLRQRWTRLRLGSTSSKRGS
jgi:GTP cyclohydrolase I